MGPSKTTRLTLFTHIGDHATRQAVAGQLSKKALSVDVKIIIGQRFALRDGAKAHQALAGRASAGSTVL